MNSMVMITNGGPHPGSLWAETTAAMISALVQVEDTADLSIRRSRMRLELDLTDALESCMTSRIDNYRATGQDADSDEIASALAVVERVTLASPFAIHYSKPEVADCVRQYIVNHFKTISEIEQGWANNSPPAA